MISLSHTGAPLRIALLMFFISIVYFLDTKPDLMFTEDGKMKQFGLKKNETTFTMINVCTLLSILTLIIVQ